MNTELDSSLFINRRIFIMVLCLLIIAGIVGMIVHTVLAMRRKKYYEDFKNKPALSDYIFFSLLPLPTIFVCSLFLFYFTNFQCVEYNRTPYVVIEETPAGHPYRYHINENEIIEYRKKHLDGTWFENSSYFSLADGTDVYTDNISGYEDYQMIESKDVNPVEEEDKSYFLLLCFFLPFVALIIVPSFFIG